MLLAINDQQEYINAKEAIRNLTYRCPGCEAKVILKRGSRMMPHFAHQKNAQCNVMSEGESQTHISGKKHLTDFFKLAFPHLQLEYYLSEIQQRPDIMLNSKIVIEYQCSPITTERLLERISGYKSLQITSYWILGPKYYAIKRNHYKIYRQFMNYSKKWGFFLMFWSVEHQTLIIRHQIKLFKGQISFLEQSFRNLKQVNHYRNLSDFSPKIALADYLFTSTTKLFHKYSYHNRLNFKIQNVFYKNGRILVGCPLICHLPIVDLPWQFSHLIELKAMILISIEVHRQIAYDQLYDEVVQFFALNEQFGVLKVNLVDLIIKRFLTMLTKRKYVLIQMNVIYLLQPFKWFDDVMAKLNQIKKIPKTEI